MQTSIIDKVEEKRVWIIFIYPLQTMFIILKSWTLAITGSTSPGTSSTHLVEHHNNIIEFHAHMVKPLSTSPLWKHFITALNFLQMFQSAVLLWPSHQTTPSVVCIVLLTEHQVNEEC